MTIGVGRNLPFMHFHIASYEQRNVGVWQMFSLVSQNRSGAGLRVTSTRQSDSPRLFLAQEHMGTRNQTTCLAVCRWGA